MGVRISELTEDTVVLEAPLEPNLNHRDTAFGGSVSALAILAGWTLVHFKLRAEGFETHTVIQKSSVDFEAPVEATFRALCSAPAAKAWARFTRTLERRGKARIRLQGVMESGSHAVGSFRAAYVAILRGS